MTIKEVAAALGVSVMTVSNAYNRPDQIAPATRARVLAEAARMGYSGPNPTARSLRRQRTGVIGLLSRAPLSYAFSDPAAVLFTQGVSLASEPAHLGLLLLSGTDPEDPATVTEAAVDGMLAVSVAARDPLLAVALGRRLPLVLVDGAPHPGVPRVGIDDEGGARAAADHVLGLGHRRIGVIALGKHDAEGRLLEQQIEARHPVARTRLNGYAAALEAAGLPWADIPVYTCRQSTPDEGAVAARSLLARASRPTALLVMSDQLAFGVLNAAQMLGLRVPDDLSVVGFDDVPLAAWIEPALTTVRQPHLEKGLQAARLLLVSMQSDLRGVPEDIVLPTTLVVRATTAPPQGE
jgi:DNA-binding LacI/PurR family transcriptional regulator